MAACEAWAFRMIVMRCLDLGRLFGGQHLVCSPMTQGPALFSQMRLFEMITWQRPFFFQAIARAAEESVSNVFNMTCADRPLIQTMYSAAGVWGLGTWCSPRTCGLEGR